jgi:hypothetical protein
MIGLLIDSETKDLKLDAQNRLQVGTTDAQNQYLLLKLEKGAIKRLPSRCVGSGNYLESDNLSGMLREVKKEFTLDGMKVNSVGFDLNELKIDAEYK